MCLGKYPNCDSTLAACQADCYAGHFDLLRTPHHYFVDTQPTTRLRSRLNPARKVLISALSEASRAGPSSLLNLERSAACCAFSCTSAGSLRSNLGTIDMKTPRLRLALALFAFSPLAFAQAPICDVTCAPDPGGSGYDNTVDAMTKVQNMRGTQTIYAPETAGSQVTYHATGNGKNQAQGKIVAGSSSYSSAIPILSLPGRNGLDLNLTLHYNSAIWSANSDLGTMTFNGSGFPELRIPSGIWVY